MVGRSRHDTLEVTYLQKRKFEAGRPGNASAHSCRASRRAPSARGHARRKEIPSRATQLN
eukprot:157965-Alexandrium_andersonii.AAC.1